MNYSERKFYEGFIRDVIKYSSTINKKYRFSKNKIDNCLEIVYYLKGCEITKIGQKILISKPDTIIISPPHNQTDEKSQVKCEEKAEIIDIGIITPHSFSDKHITIDAGSNPKIKELFIKIYNIWSAKYDNYFFDAMTLYYAILKEIHMLLNHKEPAVKGHQKLDNAIKYIHNNYSNKNFSCNNLPELCGWGHAYFYKVFEKQFNTTPQKYTTSLRMQLAVEFLLSSELTITEIADNCGYESVAYFSRVFKNYYGVSPSKYNKKF